MNDRVGRYPLWVSLKTTVTPFVHVLGVNFVRDIRNTIEKAVFIERTVQATLTAGTIIGGENDQRVIKLTDTLKVFQYPSKLVIGVGQLDDNATSAATALLPDCRASPLAGLFYQF